jgi:hypothetical protein
MDCLQPQPSFHLHYSCILLSCFLSHIVFLHSTLRLLVAANVVPSLLILVTLMMEAIHSSETSVLTRATWHNIQEVGILHSHCRESLKSYKTIINPMQLLLISIYSNMPTSIAHMTTTTLRFSQDDQHNFIEFCQIHPLLGSDNKTSNKTTLRRMQKNMVELSEVAFSVRSVHVT